MVVLPCELANGFRWGLGCVGCTAWHCCGCRCWWWWWCGGQGGGSWQHCGGLVGVIQAHEPTHCPHVLLPSLCTPPLLLRSRLRMLRRWVVNHEPGWGCGGKYITHGWMFGKEHVGYEMLRR
jgi:hypothetical protein